jgi:hypothetical protein
VKKITIDFGDYCDETNDSREIKISKSEGPRYRDEDGDFRVSRSGYVRNGVEYWLRGFGKLDRKPGPKIEIPEEAVTWLEQKLGRAYVPYFLRNRDLRLKVSTAIKLMGWDVFRTSVETAAQQLPIVKAVEAATNYRPSQEEAPHDASPDGGIDAEDLEDMFK